MRKLMTTAAVLILAAGFTAAAIDTADAGRKGRRNTAIAAGVLGALALGAVLSQPRRAYAEPVCSYERRCRRVRVCEYDDWGRRDCWRERQCRRVRYCY